VKYEMGFWQIKKEIKEEFSKEVTANVQNTQLGAESINEICNKIKKMNE
jgi:hypothetical protein